MRKRASVVWVFAQERQLVSTLGPSLVALGAKKNVPGEAYAFLGVECDEAKNLEAVERLLTTAPRHRRPLFKKVLEK